MNTVFSSSRRRFGGIIAAVTLSAALWPLQAPGDEIRVVHLTQTACQFVESENGMDHGFTTTSKSDCEAINTRTGEQRLEDATVITLEPGKYIFRVTNRDVDYDLGFWLRGDGLIERARLPSVSGGGLSRGTSGDYEIELKPGRYVYSCPLNPTLDYALVVEG